MRPLLNLERTHPGGEGPWLPLIKEDTIRTTDIFNNSAPPPSYSECFQHS